MATYDRAHDVQPYLERMLNENHQDLRDHGVTFDVLYANAKLDKNGDEKGPAVSLGGYPCLAKVRIVPLKDRAKNCADVEIVIDQKRWDESTDECRLALIDHELEHCELCLIEGNDEAGETALVERDDLDRPKLKMRRHDRQFGWFDVVAERHGQHSPEARQLADFRASDKYRHYTESVGAE